MAIGVFATLFILAITPGSAAQDLEIALEEVASGFAAPLVAVEPPDDSGRLFIVDQTGQIWIVDSNGEMLEEPFLDVSGRMVNLNAGFDERGLLGLAFHPDYAANGRFFVYYSAPLRDGGPSGYDHTTHVSEFTVSNDPNVADPESERVLLQEDQPQGNHNAGAIAFGPDGHLYIALGDGGGANDTAMGHVDDWYAENDGGNGQDVTENLLGSILRIDVDSGDPYGIPADNPFVGNDGLDEIYAYGLRNPYRFSFDSGGDNKLIAADVGQAQWEEINVVENGGNYGWNVREGAHCFDAANSSRVFDECPTTVGAGHPDEGASLIDPVIEYRNNEVGVAVVGGYVYRGSALPEFEGLYFFGDWTGSPGSSGGPIFVATPQDEGTWPWEEVTVVDGFTHNLLAFGQDGNGELYVLGTNQTGPSGNTGVVYRIVPVDRTAAERPETPAAFALLQNYPNPFNPTTQIRFVLRAATNVTLDVFDMLGRHVSMIERGLRPAGTHTVEWDGTDTAGRAVPSGLYVYRLTTDQGVASRTMTLIR